MGLFSVSSASAAGRRRSLCVAALLCAVGVSGCTSPVAYRQAIDERDAEIRSLREERTRLKRERQGMQAEMGDLEGRLLEANAALLEKPAAPQETAIFPELDSLGIGYGMRDGKLVISIPSSITFGSGSADLAKDGRSALQTVARTLMAEYPGARYFVEGHTDADPIKKSGFASNRELSLSRAMAVLTFLVEECEIPDDRCVVAGFGQYLPVADNQDKQSKARNRRVEIVVHN